MSVKQVHTCVCCAPVLRHNELTLDYRINHNMQTWCSDKHVSSLYTIKGTAYSLYLYVDQSATVHSLLLVFCLFIV